MFTVDTTSRKHPNGYLARLAATVLVTLLLVTVVVGPAHLLAQADAPVRSSESAEDRSPRKQDNAPEASESWVDRLSQYLRSTIGPPLKAVHGPIDRLLASLPMWVAVACAVGLYAIAIVWVWMLKREFVFRGAPDERWWRDLRLWATLVVLPYVAIYLILGR